MDETVFPDWTARNRLDTPRMLALVVSLIGVMVLVGWALEIDYLTRISPRLITMKPNAALAFVLAGSSLWTLQGGVRSRQFSLGLAAMVVAISGLTLLEYASGINLGIDEILARERANAIGTLSPGRMHPLTAFDFLLLATALFMLASGRWYRCAHIFALVAALIASSALICYVYGVRQFDGLAAFNQMALHTTLGMLALAAGVLLARRDRGVMAAISSDTAGGVMARRLLPVSVVVPILINGLTMLAHEAGLFDEKVGAALRSVVVGAVMIICILRAAHILQRIDLERMGVQEELTIAHERLEQRVHDRTTELASANRDLEREVVEHRRADQELRQGELRYRSLVDAITAIVFRTPPSGTFAFEQPAWIDFTGQTFDQFKGWGWLHAVHPDDRLRTARAWSDGIASQAPYEFEHRIRRHDGEYRHMLVRGVPILLEDGSIGEWVGVHTDIEEQIRAKDALRRGKEAAEAATRAKSDFLANMSHEIRTPMNGILGMTELTLDTDLSAQQREYLGLVKSSADALLIVINDILDFSKIEAGKLDLDPIPFGLRDCVEGMLKILAVKAHDKGLELSVRIAPGIPDNLVGPSGRLQQVLVNLVGNAIKFTDCGEVVVSVESTSASDVDEECTLHLTVRDTGIGIENDNLQSILEPFTQADGSTTRKYGGTGLGLAISCKLVELMGGWLWVESDVGVGSTFHFTVKLHRQSKQPSNQPEVDALPLRDVRVLVVDDNQTNRQILEEVLRNWGATPTAVDGGAAALRVLETAALAGTPFPVVLIDVFMPAMHGYAVVDRVAENSRLADTRVVLLTSNEHSDGLTPCQSPRIAAKLSKPVRQSELLELLSNLLLSKATPDWLAPPTNAKDRRPDAARVVRRLKILVADDHVINQKVATTMLERQGHIVTVAGDGRQALDALAAGDFDLALMDLQMPELDGFETVASIRACEQSTYRHLPIVALTAYAMKGDAERCLARGFDAYLAKPIVSDKLYSVIEQVLAAKPDGLNSPSAAETGTTNHAIFNLVAALEMVGGDEGIFRQVLAMFLEDCPRLMEAIRAAVNDNDSVSLEQAARQLKSSAGQVGADGLAAAATLLEVASLKCSCKEAAAELPALSLAMDRFVDANHELATSVAFAGNP